MNLEIEMNEYRNTYFPKIDISIVWLTSFLSHISLNK